MRAHLRFVERYNGSAFVPILQQWVEPRFYGQTGEWRDVPMLTEDNAPPSGWQAIGETVMD